MTRFRFIPTHFLENCLLLHLPFTEESVVHLVVLEKNLKKLHTEGLTDWTKGDKRLSVQASHTNTNHLQSTIVNIDFKCVTNRSNLADFISLI